MKTTRKKGKIIIASAILALCCLMVCAASASGSSSPGTGTVQWTPKIIKPVSYVSYSTQTGLSGSGTTSGGTRTTVQSGVKASTAISAYQSAYGVGILPLTSPWLTPGMTPVTIPKWNSQSAVPAPTFTLPALIPLAPTDTNQTATTSSGKGSLVILGPGGAQGYIINMKSNFYDPQAILGADGKWHSGMGVTPEYWMNLFPPGSYSIQIVDPNTGDPVYCTTVTIVAGQTTTVDPSSDPCPFSGCCSC
ncbi:MAG TPA: hypothetical protein VMC42_06405 [Methanoregulaceae archaeon]|nr:hypothetical protein [Methanoregulaceae archaeon]